MLKIVHPHSWNWKTLYMTSSKDNRGGARPGAGRKIKYPTLGETVPIQLQVPRLLLDFIDEQAELDEVSRSEWITRRLARVYKQIREKP